MEISSKNLLGSPVFAIDGGEKMGQVRDYIFDSETRSLKALIIAKDKSLSEEKFLPFGNIQSLGKEAITVKNSQALRKKNQEPLLAAEYKKNRGIIGINVITVNGGSLGKVADFTIDSETGIINYITLGGKNLERFFRGINYLDTSMVEVFGSDVILAQADAVPSPNKPFSCGDQPHTQSKTARSASLWNQGKDKLIAKTKDYVEKVPKPNVFAEIKKEKPLADKGKAKGNISYKEDK